MDCEESGGSVRELLFPFLRQVYDILQTDFSFFLGRSDGFHLAPVSLEDQRIFFLKGEIWENQKVRRKGAVVVSTNQPHQITPLSSPDVLIIGGGINGIATFRELALQGVAVLLVERDDFCSGASAASSHMVHGGVRYLENGELRLVRESLTERNRLLRLAPHHVKPLPTTIPIFHLFSGILSAPLRLITHRAGKPGQRGALLIKVGLMVYDLFGRAGGTMPRHTFLGRRKSRQALPQLHPNAKYTATYFDAAMHHPERLALEVLRDGLATGQHAQALNYTSAIGAGPDGVVLCDEISGTHRHVRPRVIVNASGPWTDLTNASLGQPTAYLGGTKGSHIVMDNPELLQACHGREIFFENSDGRIVLMYPLLGRVLVGTTDIPVQMTEKVECTDEEIDYFFELVATVFPDIALSRKDIVYKYSGVRPLPVSEDLSPGVVSRDYRVVRGEVSGMPCFSLVGGKWTTFRALGEHLGTLVLKSLSLTRTVSTTSLPIGGGVHFPSTAGDRAHWVEEHSLIVGAQRATILLGRYGTHAVEYLASLDQRKESFPRFTGEYSVEELQWVTQNEWVVHLVDVALRRTTLAFTGALNEEGSNELAAIVGDVLGWSLAERAAEREVLAKALSL